jgi:hypothetical protein
MEPVASWKRFMAQFKSSLLDSCLSELLFALTPKVSSAIIKNNKRKRPNIIRFRIDDLSRMPKL